MCAQSGLQCWSRITYLSVAFAQTRLMVPCLIPPSSLQPSHLFFLSASLALWDPLHCQPTPRLGGMFPDVTPLPYPTLPYPLLLPPSLPSLFHLTQTDPASSQEGRACGAVERGCIPALSPSRAAHTLAHTHTCMDLSEVASCSTSDQAAGEHALTC